MIVWFSEHQEEWYGLIYIVNPNSCVWVFTEYSVGSHLSGWHSWASAFYNQILHTWCTKKVNQRGGFMKGRICTLKGWPCTLKSAHIPAGHKVHIYKSTTVYVPSSELGFSQPHSRQRVCPSPRNQRGGSTLACGWGVGGIPIPTTGEKLSTLPTLCCREIV
jgi:hypothetical protein